MSARLSCSIFAIVLLFTARRHFLQDSHETIEATSKTQHRANDDSPRTCTKVRINITPTNDPNNGRDRELDADRAVLGIGN